jgi:glycosyltransferase involved in cell wall biosynthesis
MKKIQKVSVIITTFNRPSFLGKAITSVANQSYPCCELIVVDDGYCCDTKKVLDKKTLNSVDIYHENPTNMGGAESRNIGVELSSGDIIMFLDDDDQWLEHKIRDQMPCFNSNSVVLAYSGRNIQYETSLGVVDRSTSSKKSGNIYPDIFVNNFVGITSSVAIRKKIFLESGGFDPSLPCRQDYDLWIRISRLGEVCWDGKYNVMYTMFLKSGDQISSQCENHPFAASYLLNKYQDEIFKLSLVKRQKCISEKWFSVAKCYRRTNYIKSIKFILMSFFYFPNIRSLSLILPEKILIVLGYKL